MTREATIGTTSYGFRYLLMDTADEPPLVSLVRQTREAGLDALQLCENARPLDVSAAKWREVLRAAADVGLDVHLGCMTLDVDTVSRYLERAATIPGATGLRIVLEDDSGRAPSRDRIEPFLAAAAIRAAEARL
jgi:hypothetical protein